MGILHSYGATDIRVRRFDNRFGEIETTHDTYIKGAELFQNGDFKESIETINIKFPNTYYYNRTGNINTNETHKIRNGAKISSKGQLRIESDSAINNEFGIIRGYSDHIRSVTTTTKVENIPNEAGLILNTPYSIRNKSGVIYSGSHILINARQLFNIIGDVHEPSGNHLDDLYHETVNGMPYSQMYRTWYESDSAHIATPNGKIFLNIEKGVNKGSFLLSPHGIHINGQEFKKDSSLPSEFAHELVSSYNRFDEHYWGKTRYGSTTWAYNLQFDHIHHGAFQSGNIIDMRVGALTISGDISAPDLAISVDTLKTQHN
jgi:adhesin HecA-like repeat protein